MSQLDHLSGSPGELQRVLASGITVVTLGLFIYGYDSDICICENFPGGFNVLHI